MSRKATKSLSAPGSRSLSRLSAAASPACASAKSLASCSKGWSPFHAGGFDVVNQFRPAVEAVLARDDPLSVGEPGRRGAWFVLADTIDGRGIAGAPGAQQVLRLLAQLFERWMFRKPYGRRIGHGDLLSARSRPHDELERRSNDLT